MGRERWECGFKSPQGMNIRCPSQLINRARYCQQLVFQSVQYRIQTKVMVIPLNATRTYVEGEIQFCAFLTLAVDGSKWSASRSGRFILGERTVVPIEQEARWAPEQVWMFWRRGKTLAPARNRTQNIWTRSLAAILTMLSWLSK